MSIDTLDIAVLPIGTRIQPCQEANRLDVLFGSLVFMLKRTFIYFRTWSAQVVIVAELVVASTFFDLLEHGGGDCEGFVEAAGTRVPIQFWVRRNDDCCAGGVASGLLFYSDRED